MTGETRKTPQFLNRELSWLAFNTRVLEEAANPANRLLERAKFAAIVASNLDEFFMVRVAALKHAQTDGERRPGPCGMTPAEQLTAVADRAHELMSELYTIVTTDILPALSAHGIDLKTMDRATEPQRAALETFFHDDVSPVLTPLAIDEERPFPMLASLTLNLAFWLAPAAGQTDRRLAVVQVPARLSRLVRLNGREGHEFVLLDDVVRSCAEALFPGQTIVESAAFRLARDSEVDPDDDGVSFVEALEAELRRRRRSSVVRLEVEETVSDGLLALLMRHVFVKPRDVYRVPRPLDLRCLMSLVDLPEFPELVDPHRQPAAILTADELDDLFAVLDQRDVLLHHPYESFDAVVRFVEMAAEDPDVLAIKQTLYRTSGDSPIVKALTLAADRGKQVTVVVELRARFDEARNILWARRLEEMGGVKSTWYSMPPVPAPAPGAPPTPPSGFRPPPVPQFERSPVIAPLPPVFSINGVAGAQVVTLSESMKRSLDLPAGVLVTTVPIGSPAAQSGLEEGDVILRVGQEAVASVRDLLDLVARAASEGERSVTLELRRGKDRRTLTLRWRQN